MFFYLFVMPAFINLVSAIFNTDYYHYENTRVTDFQIHPGFSPIRTMAPDAELGVRPVNVVSLDDFRRRKRLVNVS